MRESGRASLIVIAGIACALLVAGLFFFSGESPTAAAGDFMNALAKGDVDTLTERSYMPGNTKEQIREKWKFTMTEVAPYYRFAWHIRSQKITSDDQAAVNLQFMKDFGNPASYDEKFELPMVKRDGKWLVEVRSIEREKFPGLPR